MMAWCTVLALAAAGTAQAQPGEIRPVYRVLGEVAPNSLDWGQDTGEWVELRNPSVMYPCSVDEVVLFDNSTVYQKLADYPYDPFVPGMTIPPGGCAIVIDMVSEKGTLEREGETYQEVADYIYDNDLQDSVIIISPRDNAIGDGLADDDDMLGVKGRIVLHTPGGNRYVRVEEKVGWWSPVDERHSLQWDGHGWDELPWTPGDPE